MLNIVCRRRRFVVNNRIEYTRSFEFVNGVFEKFCNYLYTICRPHNLRLLSDSRRLRKSTPVNNSARALRFQLVLSANIWRTIPQESPFQGLLLSKRGIPPFWICGKRRVIELATEYKVTSGKL